MPDEKVSCPEPVREIPELCKECTSRHKGICGALSATELVEFNQISRQRRFRAGKTLVADEQEFPFFAIVLEGVVKLSKTLPDGRQQIVGLQFAPDFMGRPFQSESNLTVESASDVNLCTVPRKDFEKMLSNIPQLQHRLFQQTLLELDESREWLVALGRKTASERIAGFLYMIAQHVPVTNQQTSEREVTFDLPLTRTDMADFLGLTIETVSRQLGLLKKRNIVSISQNRHIVVHDMEKLEKAGSE